MISTSYSYSYRLVSVYRWRVHSRAVVFHILHRVRRETRLCPYLINYATLYPLQLPQPGSLPSNSLRYYSSPSFSASVDTTAVYLAPSRSMTTYYQQQIPTRAPFFLSVASRRSRSNHAEMYYAKILCIFLMYVSIVSNLASALAASAKVY